MIERILKQVQGLLKNHVWSIFVKHWSGGESNEIQALITFETSACRLLERFYKFLRWQAKDFVLALFQWLYKLYMGWYIRLRATVNLHVLPCQEEQQHPKPFSNRLDVLHSSVPILLLNESKALGLLLKNMDLSICISSHSACLLYLLDWSNFDNIVPKAFLSSKWFVCDLICLTPPEWVWNSRTNHYLVMPD